MQYVFEHQDLQMFVIKFRALKVNVERVVFVLSGWAVNIYPQFLGEFRFVYTL